jgi:acetoin utilization deacetylase AcuC-like enzyme
VQRITAYVSHEDCARHDTGWRHPDHQGRLPAIWRAVYRDTPALLEPLLQLEGRRASDEEVRRVHTARHVEAVRARAAEAAAAGEVLELDGVPVSGASWDAARAAAGSALTGVEAVLRGEVRNAFCAVRPPGRGARADAAGDFSLFNNVAVAARHLRERHGVRRVLVVGWGAWAAEAVEAALGGDPGTPLAWVRGVGEGEGFAGALRAALNEAGAEGAPDFVLLSAGLEGPAEEVHDATRVLVERAEAWCGGRLVSVLEGGWDATETAAAAVQHLRALAGLPPA